MSEKTKMEHIDEHSEDVKFDGGWSGMAEGISSANVEKVGKLKKAKEMLGRFAIKTVEEWEAEEKLDEDEIRAIIAEEKKSKKGVEFGETQEAKDALEEAFKDSDKHVREVLGEAELERTAVSALRLAREQGVGQCHNLINDTAGIYGLLPDNLLQVIRGDVKALMYDQERRDAAMFVLTASERDFERMISEGRLEREEDDADLMKSNLKLKEYRGVGGENEERDELKSGGVQLIFDGRLVDKESFDCLAEEPTVDEVKLDQCIGAVVSGGEDAEEKWTQLLRKREVVLPVQGDELVKGVALSFHLLDLLRKREEERQAAIREEERLERESLTDVDEKEVAETVQKYTDKLGNRAMDGLFAAYQKSETPGEFKKAEEKAHEQICEVFGLKERPELQYVKKEGTKEEPAFDARLRRADDGKLVLEINERYRTIGDASASVEMVGRENFRALQDELVERMKSDPESLSETETERAKLYGWNNRHHVSDKVDVMASLRQVREMEAREAGVNCRDKLFEAFNHSMMSKKGKLSWLRKQSQGQSAEKGKNVAASRGEVK